LVGGDDLYFVARFDCIELVAEVVVKYFFELAREGFEVAEEADQLVQVGQVCVLADGRFNDFLLGFYGQHHQHRGSVGLVGVKSLYVGLLFGGLVFELAGRIVSELGRRVVRVSLLWLDILLGPTSESARPIGVSFFIRISTFLSSKNVVEHGFRNHFSLNSLNFRVGLGFLV